jgi:hypothetical protein
MQVKSNCACTTRNRDDSCLCLCLPIEGHCLEIFKSGGCGETDTALSNETPYGAILESVSCISCAQNINHHDTCSPLTISKTSATSNIDEWKAPVTWGSCWVGFESGR